MKELVRMIFKDSTINLFTLKEKNEHVNKNIN